MCAGARGEPPVTVVLPHRSQTGQSLNQRVGGKDMTRPSRTRTKAWHCVCAGRRVWAGVRADRRRDGHGMFDRNSVEITIVNSHIFKTRTSSGRRSGARRSFDFAESVTTRSRCANHSAGRCPATTLDMKYRDDPRWPVVGRWSARVTGQPAARAADSPPHVDLTSPGFRYPRHQRSGHDQRSPDWYQRRLPHSGRASRSALGRGRVGVEMAPADPERLLVLGVAGEANWRHDGVPPRMSPSTGGRP